MKYDPANTLTTRVEPSFCPFCFRLLDAATNMTDKNPPVPGDFTVCIQCCNVLRWDEKMRLVGSSLLEIPTHSRMAFAQMVRLCKSLDRSRR